MYSLRLSHIYEPQFLYLLNKTSSKGKNTCKSYLHRKLVCRPKPKLKSSTSSCNSACVRAKWLQSCPTLCNPMDCSPPNSSVHGIFHARTLEWVAMPSSRGIFPIQVLNPHLVHLLGWQEDSLPLYYLELYPLSICSPPQDGKMGALKSPLGRLAATSPLLPEADP